MKQAILYEKCVFKVHGLDYVQSLTPLLWYECFRSLDLAPLRQFNLAAIANILTKGKLGFIYLLCFMHCKYLTAATLLLFQFP